MKTCDYNLDSFSVIAFLVVVLFVSTMMGLFSKSPDQRKEALAGGFKYVGIIFGFLLILELFKGKTFC